MPRQGRRPLHNPPVLDRGLALLAAFDRNHRRLTLVELSQRSGLPKSSAARLASRLVAWGALERDADGLLTVGLRLLEVAILAPRGHGLREFALPFMGDLSQAVKQHVLLVVRDGSHAVLVDQLTSHQAFTPIYQTGDHLPFHSTAAGLVLLAHAPTDLQEKILGQRLIQQPEMVPVSSAALRRTLAEVRRERVATFRRRHPLPTVSVSAPIVDAGDAVVAALSVLTPEHGIDPRQLFGAVRTAARGVSRILAEQDYHSDTGI